MDVQPVGQGVLWPEAGAESAESTPVPAFLSESETWRRANRQAARERAAGGHSWRWWDRRRRELAGWPEEEPRRRANRAALVDVLAAGARPLMPAWRKRRDALLLDEGGDRVLPRGATGAIAGARKLDAH